MSKTKILLVVLSICLVCGIASLMFFFNKILDKAEKIKHTITLVACDSTISTIKANHNTTINEPKSQNLGDDYVFCGWYLDEEYLNRFDFTEAITDDLVLYAKWIKNSENSCVCKIEYITDGGIFSSATTDNLNYESVLTIPTISRTGYIFLGWEASNISATAQTSSNNVSFNSWDGSRTTNRYFKNLTNKNGKTIVFYANWRQISQAYNISYDFGGLTNVKGTLPTVSNSNGQITIPNPTRTGYTFDGWISYDASIDAQTSSNNSSFSVWNCLTPTKNKYFKNLAIQSSVTMVAKWSVASKLTMSVGVDNKAPIVLFNSTKNWVFNTSLYRTAKSNPISSYGLTWKKPNGANNLDEKYTTMRLELNMVKKDYSFIKVELYFGASGTPRFALFYDYQLMNSGVQTIDLDLKRFYNNGQWATRDSNAVLTEIYIKPYSYQGVEKESDNVSNGYKISFINKNITYKNTSYIEQSYEQILSQRERFLINPQGTTNDFNNKMSDKVTYVLNNFNSSELTIDTTKTTLASTAKMTENYQKIYKLAEAYKILKNSNENQTKQAEILARIKIYLAYMNKNFYSKGYNNSSIQGNHNWFDWEIDSPLYFLDTFVLIRDSLTNDDFATIKSFNNYVYYPKRTGESIFAQARSCVIAGALEKDYKRIAYAVSVAKEEMQFVEMGDGFHSDGSMIQHRYHAYNGHYGLDGLYRMVQLTDMISNTCFAFTSQDLTQQYNVLTTCFIPIMYDGVSMDLLRGRLPTLSDRLKGEHFLYSMALMTDYIKNSNQLTAIKSIIKLIYRDDTSLEYINSTTKYSKYMIIKILESIKNDSLITADKSYETVYKVFGDMDIALAKYYNDGDLIGIGVKMSSNRIAKYESINGNNQNGWYSGDGMTYIYEDVDDFGWKYWGQNSTKADTYMLAGTTVTNAKRNLANVSDLEKFSPYSFVGGTQNGNYIASAMQLSGACGNAFSSTLRANKSYFIFNNFLVCLGNGISCEDGQEVYTVIENRKYTSTNKLYFGDTQIALSSGQSGRVTSRNIYLTGYGAIYIPLVMDLNNVYYKIQSGYVIFYIKHGVNPTNDKYAYIIYPSRSATKATLKNKINSITSSLTIHQNTIYCTRVTYQKVVQCVFWPNLEKANTPYRQNNTGGSSPDYKASTSCIFIHNKNTNKVSLVEPMRKFSDITLSIKGNNYSFTGLSNGQTVIKSVS